MHFECCPELGSPAHFFTDPRNVAVALQEIALAGLCPQRQHEEIDVGSREAGGPDDRSVLAELLIDDPEQLTGTRRPALPEHRESLRAVHQRSTMVGKIDRRID